MLCLKKRRTYSFTQGTCVDLPRRSKKDVARYEGSLNMAITTLPRKNRIERYSQFEYSSATIKSKIKVADR
ncbi:cordon-bleu protein-like 1 [Vespula squamosa]|uniref:Cordon-bleu protein-like 1 n=1 Tax=Vespula squamosa TaxID=30214 RepID=A0ABD1ZSV0_VESSQ